MLKIVMKTALEHDCSSKGDVTLYEEALKLLKSRSMKRPFTVKFELKMVTPFIKCDVINCHPEYDVITDLMLPQTSMYLHTKSI